MKVILLCLIIGGILGISQAYDSCEKQSDCKEDECCLDNFFFKRPYCHKRYQAGKGCVASAETLYKPETDLYYLACPCVNMYECVGKLTTENGRTFMKDPKCIMPTI